MTKATQMNAEAILDWMTADENSEAAMSIVMGFFANHGVSETGINAIMTVAGALIEASDHEHGEEAEDATVVTDDVTEAEVVGDDDDAPEAEDDAPEAEDDAPVAEADVPVADAAEEAEETEAEEEGEETEAEEEGETTDEDDETLFTAVGIDDDTIAAKVADLGDWKKAQKVLKAMDVKLPGHMTGKKSSDAEKLEFVAILATASENISEAETDDLTAIAEAFGIEVKLGKAKKADKVKALTAAAIMSAIAEDLSSVTTEEEAD